jgi:hypothetical protein
LVTALVGDGAGFDTGASGAALVATAGFGEFVAVTLAGAAGAATDGRAGGAGFGGPVVSRATVFGNGVDSAAGAAGAGRRNAGTAENFAAAARVFTKPAL